MSTQFNNFQLGIEENLEEKLQLLSPGFQNYRILKKSIDARGRAPHWVMSVETFMKGETPPRRGFELSKAKLPQSFPPVAIVGSGPAGLFAALRLCERGIPCTLFEQGSEASDRMKKIAAYWRYGRLDPKNNVCFGEGGAGLYSDGKLITRIRSPYIPYVLEKLVQFGAPEEILYLSNPHVGSDKIRRIIPPLRNYLIQLGCRVRFNTKVYGLSYEKGRVSGVELEDGTIVKASSVVLATGHSAVDILEHLRKRDVALEGKSFAVGLRIEHPQKEIDKIQFKDFAGNPKLGAATYRLTDHDPSTGVGVYSFCMCPGGYVIASSTEEGTIVANGMSNYARNSPYANAALVISIDHQSHFGSDTFGGMKFRKELELAASAQVSAQGGTREFPSQRVIDFLEEKKGPTLPSSSPSSVVPSRLDQLFSKSLYSRIARAIERFDRKMPGFLSHQAQLHGVESRTSCPVRVVRDLKTLQSISHSGLYPTGEGAGYAGGITSAAVDGVRVAEAIFESF